MTWNADAFRPWRRPFRFDARKQPAGSILAALLPFAAIGERRRSMFVGDGRLVGGIIVRLGVR